LTPESPEPTLTRPSTSTHLSAPLLIALGEYDTGWHDAATSLARAGEIVRAGAAAGAALVALPEMCTTGFTMDPARAEPVESASVSALGALAAGAGVHLLAGVAVREEVEGAERLVNAAVLFDEAGRIASVYRKQRVFAYAGEHEVYAAGQEPLVASVHGVRIAPFVCYDLRFPELFRAVAPAVDAMIVIANWPAARRTHWDTLLRARAIENQCYVVGVNRTGSAGGLAYHGGSAAYDPWGEPAMVVRDGARVVDVQPDRVRAVREEYPFLRDLGGG
jgi:omega-amidase